LKQKIPKKKEEKAKKRSQKGRSRKGGFFSILEEEAGGLRASIDRGQPSPKLGVFLVQRIKGV